jgi:hypothetical protein
MSLSLVPGPDGSPVPEGIKLIRMANEPKVANLSPEAVRRVQDGKAIPAFFELSSEDKKQLVPRLSVWVEGLTTVDQAWVLVGSNPSRSWVVRLEVNQVRSVFADTVNGAERTPNLEVEWEQATQLTDSGERVPETRPGCEGHAGIANLDKGNKTQRNLLRMQLADFANVQILPKERLAALTEPDETSQS